MSPKKALLILSPFIALLILSFLMVALGQFNIAKNSTQNATTATQNDQSAVKEAEDIETLIEKKIEEKNEAIKSKPVGQAFSQDEIDFLVNPRQKVMDEIVDEDKNDEGQSEQK